MSNNLQDGIFNIWNHTNFLLQIVDNGNTNGFVSMIQYTDLPTIRNPITEINVKTQGQNSGQISSATIEHDIFTVRIILDEEFQAYKDIVKWMQSNVKLGKGKNSSYSHNYFPPAYLHILNNNKDRIVMTFVFDKLFPTEIGGIEVDVTASGHSVTTANVILGCRRLWLLDGNGDYIGGYSEDEMINGSFRKTELSDLMDKMQKEIEK